MSVQSVPRTQRSQMRSAVSEWTAKPKLVLVRTAPRRPTIGDRFAAWAWHVHDTSGVLWAVLGTAFLSGAGAILIGWWQP